MTFMTFNVFTFWSKTFTDISLLNSQAHFYQPDGSFLSQRMNNDLFSLQQTSEQKTKLKRFGAIYKLNFGRVYLLFFIIIP